MKQPLVVQVAVAWMLLLIWLPCLLTCNVMAWTRSSSSSNSGIASSWGTVPSRAPTSHIDKQQDNNLQRKKKKKKKKVHKHKPQQQQLDEKNDDDVGFAADRHSVANHNDDDNDDEDVEASLRRRKRIKKKKKVRIAHTQGARKVLEPKKGRGSTTRISDELPSAVKSSSSSFATIDTSQDGKPKKKKKKVKKTKKRVPTNTASILETERTTRSTSSRPVVLKGTTTNSRPVQKGPTKIIKKKKKRVKKKMKRTNSMLPISKSKIGSTEPLPTPLAREQVASTTTTAAASVKKKKRKKKKKKAHQKHQKKSRSSSDMSIRIGSDKIGFDAISNSASTTMGADDQSQKVRTTTTSILDNTDENLDQNKTLASPQEDEEEVKDEEVSNTVPSGGSSGVDVDKSGQDSDRAAGSEEESEDESHVIASDLSASIQKIQELESKSLPADILEKDRLATTSPTLSQEDEAVSRGPFGTFHHTHTMFDSQEDLSLTKTTETSEMDMKQTVNASSSVASIIDSSSSSSGSSNLDLKSTNESVSETKPEQKTEDELDRGNDVEEGKAERDSLHSSKSTREETNESLSTMKSFGTAEHDDEGDNGSGGSESAELDDEQKQSDRDHTLESKLVGNFQVFGAGTYSDENKADDDGIQDGTDDEDDEKDGDSAKEEDDGDDDDEVEDDEKDKEEEEEEDDDDDNAEEEDSDDDNGSEEDDDEKEEEEDAGEEGVHDEGSDKEKDDDDDADDDDGEKGENHGDEEDSVEEEEGENPRYDEERQSTFELVSGQDTDLVHDRDKGVDEADEGNGEYELVKDVSFLGTPSDTDGIAPVSSNLDVSGADSYKGEHVESSNSTTSLPLDAGVAEEQHTRPTKGLKPEFSMSSPIASVSEDQKTEISGRASAQAESIDLENISNLTDNESDLKVSVVTWNLAEESPSEEDAAFFRKFREAKSGANEGSDIVLISGQECENIKPRRSEGRRSREFRRLMIMMLGRDYVPIALHLLGGIQFGLFCKRNILGDVELASIADVTCGIGNVFHNKGAIGCFLQMRASRDPEVASKRAKSIRMLFVTAHMAAHVKNAEARDSDFWRIASELEEQAPPRFFPEKKSNGETSGAFLLESMDRIFFCGDLNYRIDLPREQVEYAVATMKLALESKSRGNAEKLKALRKQLLTYDQLRASIALQRAFPGFSEGQITFPPTFKFDKGTDDYDTSHKQRMPAWTDRILFKADGTRVLEYDSVPSARHSDHRPVYATFRVNMLGRELTLKQRTRRRSRKSSRQKRQ